MIHFSEIKPDTDDWELFARDFLRELGLTIESPPDRGADRGKDILALETPQGPIHNQPFRWLVSCKHFAGSDRSVSETRDELNILERLRDFSADGFLGFYSTIASSGLNARLRELRKNGDIRDYEIFDHRRIETELLRIGLSPTLWRYFPDSAAQIRPLHEVLGEYLPIPCDVCDRDLLEAMYREEYSGLVGRIDVHDDKTGEVRVEDLYFACKGACDRTLRERYRTRYKTTCPWKDLSDLVIPAELLRWIMATLNQLRDPKYVFSDRAFEREKTLIMALSQKVFREMTEVERERLSNLAALPPGV